MQLEAWFDGEEPDGLGLHLVACAPCFRHLRALARIRAALRQHAGVETATTLPAPGRPAWRPPGRPAWRPPTVEGPIPGWVPRAIPRHPRLPVRATALAAVPLVLVLVSALLGVGVVPSPLHPGLSPAASRAGARSLGNDGGAGTATGAGAQGATGVATAPGGSQAPEPGSGPARDPTGGAGPGGTAGPLRLAVVVPTQGTAATEGLAVVDAVQKAVGQADAAGGVHGAPVQLTVVPAEDAAAVSALAGHVDAVVGGFGAAVPASVPWILPADPWVTGTAVVPAELGPVEAGIRLGQDLVERGVTGTVGVVVGSGPDAALEQGLAEMVPVSTVDVAPGGSCLPALGQLQPHVAAVAVAGSPGLAASCLAALAAMAWQPSGGVLLAPSAAYGGVPASLAGESVFSVLGLPWPTASSAGAADFRSAVPGVHSYRALVSFAAVELAVQVARTAGTLRLADVAGGSWTSALYDFAGTENAGAEVVEGSPGGWVSAP